jgi:hypothetical protein
VRIRPIAPDEATQSIPSVNCERGHVTGKSRRENKEEPNERTSNGLSHVEFITKRCVV